VPPTTTRVEASPTPAGDEAPGGALSSAATQSEAWPQPAPLLAGHRVPRVTMDIVLNHLDRRLRVTHHVDLVNHNVASWHEVVFAVLPAHTPGVFELDRAEVTTPQGQQAVWTKLDGIMLHVPLPDPVGPGEPLAVTLSYELCIPRVDPDVWLPVGNLGAGDHVIQGGDWHPTLVPYRAGAGWQTWTYHAVGDPVVYPIADYDIQIFADPAVVIAAPGLISEDGHVRRYMLPGARSFAFLASLEYAVAASSVAGLPLRAYYLPGNDGAAQAALETAARAIELFDELYGDYPAQELVIAENAYVGSMEYSGLISLSTEAFTSYVDNPAAHLAVLTVHETAHQWWYGAVGNDQVREPWLDEAFAKYSELLYFERYAPELMPWWWETHVYSHEPTGTLDRTIYDFDTTVTYFDELYGQAARFLADLRAQMGDDAFFSFVGAYGEAGRGKLVTGADFFDHLLVATDEDLRPLIDRYFETVSLD